MSQVKSLKCVHLPFSEYYPLTQNPSIASLLVKRFSRSPLPCLSEVTSLKISSLELLNISHLKQNTAETFIFSFFDAVFGTVQFIKSQDYESKVLICLTNFTSRS